jgi:hypothetical protein
MIETREHELARLAVIDCLNAVTFGDVLIFTDRPEKFLGETWTLPTEMCGQPVRFIQVPDWPDKLGWSRCAWHGPAQHLRTRHTLNIQWDSWIWDTSMWRDDFLDYDYVGSPWWYKDGLNVGNGGFSLRSTRLCRFLYKNRSEFPVITHVDDDLLCRKYRPKLEERGFNWAPQDIAHDFAFECARPSGSSRHFGFHAPFNFGVVLDRERLIERTRIMLRSPYIRRTGYMWESFYKCSRTVVDELLAEGGPDIRAPQLANG